MYPCTFKFQPLYNIWCIVTIIIAWHFIINISLYMNNGVTVWMVDGEWNEAWYFSLSSFIISRLVYHILFCFWGFFGLLRTTDQFHFNKSEFHEHFTWVRVIVTKNISKWMKRITKIYMYICSRSHFKNCLYYFSFFKKK